MRGCLNKIPKMRPTYSMLLAHGWLASLSKPATIREDEEEEDEVEVVKVGQDVEEAMAQLNVHSEAERVIDQEVADWVKAALERKRLGLMGRHETPALHKAPLDRGFTT